MAVTEDALFLRKLLLSSCLFLDALAAGAIPALLPFLVTTRHSASDARKVAQLLAINYGCTLSAMLPSGLLLLYSWHVPLLTAGLCSLLGVCLLLAVNAHKEWQLQLAMVLAGCSAEFTFAGALAIVSKLQAQEQTSGGTEKRIHLVKSSEPKGDGQRRASNGDSSKHRDDSNVLVFGEKQQFGTSYDNAGAECVAIERAGARQQFELQYIIPDAGSIRADSLAKPPSMISFPRSPRVQSPRSRARPVFIEELSLASAQLEGPAAATDLVQDVGLLFGAQSLGYALGPSLVPLMYGFMQAWVPFLIIGGLTAVLLPPLLFMLLSAQTQQRRLGVHKRSAWSGPQGTVGDNDSGENLSLIKAETKSQKPAERERGSSTSASFSSEHEVQAKQQETPTAVALKELLTSPHALPAIVTLLVEGVAVGSIDTVVPSFLKDTCHTSIIANGLVFGGLALAYAVVAYKGTSWAIQRVGDIHTMVGGMALMAAALPILSLQTLCGKLWGQLLVMLTIGSGMALMSGPIFPRLLRALELKGIESEGLAVIVYDVLYAGGMVVGPLITSLFTKGSWSSHFLSLLSVVLMLTIVVMYLIDCILTRDDEKKVQRDLPLARTTSIR